MQNSNDSLFFIALVNLTVIPELQSTTVYYGVTIIHTHYLYYIYTYILPYYTLTQTPSGLP